MKIQKLIIRNFRGLKGEDNIINFSNSNIIFLIGQNNVGKSTFLRAYEFFVNSAQAAVKEDFYNYDTDIPIVIEGWFLKEEDDDDDDPELQKNGKKTDPEWANKWVAGDGYIKIRKTWAEVGKFKKETFSPQQSNWVENGFGGMDSLFSKYSPTPIAINAMEDEKSLEEKVNKLIQDNFIKKVRENHQELCAEIVEKIKELQNAITSSEDVNRLNENLNKNFKETFSDLTLKIQPSKEENIKIEDAFKKNHTVSVQKDRADRTESFLQNGHGVIRQALFNFIAFLKENIEGNKKEYLILFEEPELFLHPKVTFKLRESLYNLAEDSPYQILCATHSPMMIDVSKPHSSLIRTVKLNGEETKTYQIGDEIFAKDEERKQRVQMINRFNPHICEAFYADKVLLVEGDTETIVYRDLLKRFYQDKEVFVLNTGSKNNIPFFQEILTDFRIKHYIIHDMDNELNSNGNKNSAWTLNITIGSLVDKANLKEPDLARRYVHNANFENAHKYNLLSGKDKPLQAYKFVSQINRNGEIPDCLRWLDDILGNQEILHDSDYIEANKKTLEQIIEEKKSYSDL